MDSLEAGMLPSRTGRPRPPVAASAIRSRSPGPWSASRRNGRCSTPCDPASLRCGPRLRGFEEALGRWLGAHHVSAISSGTAGLHLAVRAAGVEPGDEVVTSPFSFVASANCLLYENARPVFCDIDPRTLNLDPAAAAAAVTERTTGLLPVHIFGYPADVPAFERLAAERSLSIVEDACEALGGLHADGARVGNRGHLATFGFYPNKQLTTGEGGALVAPSAEVKERIDSERNQGRAPDMGWLDHDRLGFNYRLDGLLVRPGPGRAPAPRRHAGRPGPRGLALQRGPGRRRGPGAPVPGQRGGDRRGSTSRLRGPGAARDRPRHGHKGAARTRRAARSPICRRFTS